MRHEGTCYELVGMRPHDHIGWVFDGPGDFEELARRYLAEGMARRELLMFVAEDPDPEVVGDLADFGREGSVQVASIAEVYGDSGIVDPEGQRATFASVLEQALADGYSGIRVAADNTPLVVDPVRLDAWRNWECVADRFMSENAVTGLCAFDRHQVDVDQLRHLATLHPLVSATTPAPQFRLFVDDEALWVDGLLDTFAISEVHRALQALGPKTPLVIELNRVTFMSERVFAELASLSERSIEVTLQGSAESLRSARLATGFGREHLHFIEVEGSI